MSKILISYRREDSADVTGRIYDWLIQQFDRDSVFKDVDSIPLGVDFRTYLDERVAKCQVFLAVIGRYWMRKRGGKGKSRLEDPGDYVRIEIESALKRGIPVIPVLVGGASIPPADRLPVSIQDLAFRNGVAIRTDPDFHHDMDRLLKSLKQQIQVFEEQRAEGDISPQNAGQDLKRRPPEQEPIQSPRTQSVTPRVEPPSTKVPASMVQVPKGPSLDEQDWRRVIESLNRGKCILLCGNDLCGPDRISGPAPSDGPSLTSVLARKLAKSLSGDMDMQPGSEEDLAHVAQLRYNKDGDRSDLEFEIKEFYEPLDKLTTDFYRDLACLPFTLCLTTIPAHFLSNAFYKEGRTPVLDFYHFRRARPLPETNSQRPIVYHLFGDLSAVDSLVLTERDLHEFMVNIVRGEPPLPRFVAAQLADPETSILFLGFGFQRWYTRSLLHALWTYNHRNRSIAVEAATFFDHPDSKHTAIFFEREHKIAFRQHSWFQFAAELRRRYEKAQRPTPTLRELPADVPMVFLCYDMRDREHVKQVEARLQAGEVGIWRDQQDLRGGDEWDRLIQQVLEKRVDYVLVLQTPNMLDRAESYIHKEIKIALERQDRFDAGERFLIPAILQGRAGLERLSRLQSVDLTARDGVERLVKEILEDWAKRRSRSRTT
jgi:hypothetical protein